MLQITIYLFITPILYTLPMLGLGAKMGPKNQNHKQGDRA